MGSKCEVVPAVPVTVEGPEMVEEPHDSDVLVVLVQALFLVEA